MSHAFLRFSICLSFSSCGTHLPLFWTFPISRSRLETVGWLTSNCSAICFLFANHVRPTMLAISHLRIFWQFPMFPVVFLVLCRSHQRYYFFSHDTCPFQCIRKSNTILQLIIIGVVGCINFPFVQNRLMKHNWHSYLFSECARGVQNVRTGHMTSCTARNVSFMWWPSFCSNTIALPRGSEDLHITIPITIYHFGIGGGNIYWW